MKKIHEIVTAINENRKSQGNSEKVTYTIIVNHIKQKYPDVPVVEETPWMTGVEDNISIEVLNTFVTVEEPNNDLQPHLFIAFPHSGVFVMPVNLDGTSCRWINIYTSKVGTTDLFDCLRDLPEGCDLNKYADWLNNRYSARKITYEEFKGYAMRGIQGFRPLDNKELPMDLVKPADLKKEI